MKKTLKNEQGQALLFVVVTMTVALSIGMGVSLRTLSSISRSSRSDTATRIRAAAEGGAENVLSRSDAELSTLASTGDEVLIEFDPVDIDKDKVKTAATVTVADYIPTASTFTTTVREGHTTEINLEGESGSVEVCWSSLEDGRTSDIYLVIYNDTGIVAREGFTGSYYPLNGAQESGRVGLPWSFGTNFSSGGSDFDYSDQFYNCQSVSLPSNPLGLRVRAIHADTAIGVKDLDATQGYIITSVGRLDTGATPIEAAKVNEATVEVKRSFPYLPGVFDFGLYSNSGSIN